MRRLDSTLLWERFPTILFSCHPQRQPHRLLIQHINERRREDKKQPTICLLTCCVLCGALSVQHNGTFFLDSTKGHAFILIMSGERNNGSHFYRTDQCNQCLLPWWFYVFYQGVTKIFILPLFQLILKITVHSLWSTPGFYKVNEQESLFLWKSILGAFLEFSRKKNVF